MVPQDLEKLLNKRDVSTEKVEKAEQLTALWISAYFDEVARVESFFNDKLEELIDSFILMQDRFRLKAELYLSEKDEKELKKKKKKELQDVDP
jgi:cell shape-determining protein MreC